MNNLYISLKNYIFKNLELLTIFTHKTNEPATVKEIEKLNTQPFYGFAIMLDGLIVQYTIAETKNAAIDKKPASWWLENPEARVIELELIEKRHG
jgi:hypothetical protein